MKKILIRIMSVFFILAAMGMTVCAADANDIQKNRVFQVNSDVELHEGPDASSAVTAALPSGTPVIIKEDAKDGWCMVAYKEQTGYVQISFLGILGSQAAPAASNPQDGEAIEITPDNGAVQNNEIQSDDGSTQNNEVQSAEEAPQAVEMQPDDEVVQAMQSEPNDMAMDVNALEEEFRIVQEENILAYQEAEAAMEQAKSDRIWGIVIAVLVIAIFAVGIVTTLNKGKKKEQ